jgi:uroporphyrin-III C-methyltransferase
MSGKVYLVGAGPGDPDLLTVKTVRILGEADVVLHDDLVSPAVLKLVAPGALIRNVGKRCGNKRVTQEEIHTTLVSYARRGLCVVRLKGGDPLIFGRAGEEIDALWASGIDYEIVPGVTAASSAAAAAGIALTDRRGASSLVFLSGHPSAPNTTNEWPALDGAQRGLRGATVVIYMPGSDYAKLQRELEEAGVDGHSPCLLISGASTAASQTYQTIAGQLGQAPALASPKILIVGEVAKQRPRRKSDANIAAPAPAKTPRLPAAAKKPAAAHAP